MDTLKIRNVTIRFDGLHALADLSLELPGGLVLGLIGPNGAGKTTVLNCISGFYRPSTGRIEWKGRNLVRMRTHERIGAGIARTFQYQELFPTMSVLDNLLVGLHAQGRRGMFGAAFWTPGFRREERALRETARRAMRFLDLTEFEDWPVGALSYGIRKRVDICRALASEPEILLMDEPASGLTAEDVGRLADLIHRIRDEFGTAVLLVEHRMDLVMRACDRVAVMDRGKLIAEGTPPEIQRNPQVIEAYLGSAHGVAKKEG